MIIDTRQIIMDELARRNWSRYRLAEDLRDYMHPNTVYKYLQGAHESITERCLMLILQHLDIELTSKA